VVTVRLSDEPLLIGIYDAHCGTEEQSHAHRGRLRSIRHLGNHARRDDMADMGPAIGFHRMVALPTSTLTLEHPA
jgi:hypothetical protein